MGFSKNNITALSKCITSDDVVIVAPLNWGLGHAIRCIPIINWLNANCKEVIIASDGTALDILISVFPNLKYEVLPSYRIRYRYENIIFNLLSGMPSIIKAVIAEKSVARSIVKKYKANVILSDNRLGFYNSQIKNLYMTHQVNILHSRPLISWIGTRLHQFFINKYNHVIIPDFDDQRALCPKLSHGFNKNVIWIGPISRIKKLNLQVNNDIVIILSGPEPQRTILEDKLLNLMAQLQSYSVVFVRGTDIPIKINRDNFQNCTFHDIAGSAEIEKLLNRSRLLIARSGYSTIMDVYNLNIKAIWIPTPGQTEQEYLAQVHLKPNKYLTIRQDNVENLETFVKQLI